MYILSVDTTAKTASVCVAREDEAFGALPLAELTVNATVTHSESLLPMVDKALSLSELSLSDIGCFSLPAGPGSFTGVRIGVAAIKGLSFALNDTVPCLPLSTLHCLAVNLSSYGEKSVLCPLMDARREQFYNALFEIRDGKVVRLCDDRITTAEELTRELSERFSDRTVILNGDGAVLYDGLRQKYGGDALPNVRLCAVGDLYQRALSGALLAAETIKSGVDLGKFTGEALSPMYLRLSQAERERNERLSEKTETVAKDGSNSIDK